MRRPVERQAVLMNHFLGLVKSEPFEWDFVEAVEKECRNLRQQVEDTWRPGNELPALGLPLEIKFVGDQHKVPVVIGGVTVGETARTYTAKRTVLADSYSPQHVLLEIDGADHPQEVNTKTFFWRIL